MKAVIFSVLFTIGPLLGSQIPLAQIQKSAREFDALLTESLAQRKIAPQPLTDDATFVRRTYLGIIGRIPSFEEAKTFLTSESPDKRKNLIERLVHSRGLKSKLFNYWSDLFRLETHLESHGVGWHVWLQNAVDQNMSYRDMVHAMLSAQGHTAENPAVGYYLRDRGMLLDNVSNTAQVFHGLQIGCAQCHDHPFDEFTQMEYYRLASFLGHSEYRFQEGRKKIAQIVDDSLAKDDQIRKIPRGAKGRKMRKKNRQKLQKKRKAIKELGTIFRYHNRNAVSENFQKTLKLPDDYDYPDGQPGKAVEAKTSYGPILSNVPPEQRRQAFANWATSPEHPYFTKVIANRLWDYVFGYGLVPILDDWGNSPDPLHPELVSALEKTMKASNYDVKEFLRILYHTQLFQRVAASQEPNTGFSFHFAGPVLRRLDAEELRDSFVTLKIGVVDENRNTSLAEAWDRYTQSFQYIMNASASEIREIKNAIDQSSKRRENSGAKIPALQKKLRKAKNTGNLSRTRMIQEKIQKFRMEMESALPVSKPGSPADRARAASRRRIAIKKSLHKRMMLRSSELPAPSGGSSFLREFGASDRKTPDAGHTHASVPQILRLLNGQETVAFTKRNTHFAKRLKTFDTPEARLEFLFLSLYSAFPNAEEKSAFLSETQTAHDAAVLARAMLTSNRFLFVQ